MTMDALSLIIALVAGLYEMVPWRGILISIGIAVWFYATYMPPILGLGPGVGRISYRNIRHVPRNRRVQVIVKSSAPRR